MDVHCTGQIYYAHTSTELWHPLVKRKWNFTYIKLAIYVAFLCIAMYFVYFVFYILVKDRYIDLYFVF